MEFTFFPKDKPFFTLLRVTSEFGLKNEACIPHGKLFPLREADMHAS